MKQPFLAYPEKPVPRLAVFSLIVLLALRALAQSPTVTERGPHHRVWQYVTQEIDETGAVTEAVHSYTELATGLHYLDGATGQWLESKEEFELVEGAAVARQGPHQVILLANIADDNAVDLLTPDDKRFISNPRYLSFYDAKANKNVLIAEVKESIGVLVAPNVVLYDDCFDTLKGAIRYTYTRSSFEQDILLYEDPGSPADHGLNPETTLIEIYSEFSAAPEPRKKTRVVASGLEDEELDFEVMQIGRGKAFALLADGLAEEVGVAKTWTAIADRQFLVESAPYLEMKPLLETLPAKPQAKARNPNEERVEQVRAKVFRGRQELVAAMKRQATDPAQAKTKNTHSIQVVSVPSTKMAARSAVVIDYVTLNTSQTNYTFKCDETYYITGTVFLSSTTAFEAGTVIKFAAGTKLQLDTASALKFEGTPYRQVVFTAKDDDSVGQSISGSSGNPYASYYADPALYLDGDYATSYTLTNLRINHAKLGLQFFYNASSSPHLVRHLQMVHCEKGIQASYATVAIRNALMHNVLTNFYNFNSSAARVEHLTVNTATWLNYNPVSSSVVLTNCLLAAVANTGSYSGSGNGVESSVAGIFQAKGGGSNYLAAASVHRNAGVTNIDATLAKDLKNLTTYPPLELTTHFTVNTTLSPQAQRDADTPDRGYHYDPLDFVWSALNLTNATLTLTNGVAVAFYGSKGTVLRRGAIFVSEGTPANLNRLTRYENVQEQSYAWGSTTTPWPLLELNVSSTPNPDVRLLFTDVTRMAGNSTRRYLLNLQASYALTLALSHCQVRGVYQDLGSSATSATTVSVTNNLLQRCTFNWSQGTYYYPFSLTLYNNLFLQGAVTFDYDTNSTTWTVKDNLFDPDTLSNTSTYSFAAGYNGYRSGLTSLGGSGNKTGLVPDYQSGAATNWFGVLGNFYYPTNGTSTSLTNLLNTGSRLATAATLYHFTTTTNQVKEAGTQVDIGYHYVAADANNQPNDYDGDGLPDYLEDRNGNGSYDSGSETDWQTSNNGMSGAAALQVFTPLK